MHWAARRPGGASWRHMATDGLDVLLKRPTDELYQIEPTHALLLAILFEPLCSFVYLWDAADNLADGCLLVLSVRDVTG